MWMFTYLILAKQTQLAALSVFPCYSYSCSDCVLGPHKQILAARYIFW